MTRHMYGAGQEVVKLKNKCQDNLEKQYIVYFI
jgi:hypothetical protein